MEHSRPFQVSPFLVTCRVATRSLGASLTAFKRPAEKPRFAEQPHARLKSELVVVSLPRDGLCPHPPRRESQSPPAGLRTERDPGPAVSCAAHLAQAAPRLQARAKTLAPPRPKPRLSRAAAYITTLDTAPRRVGRRAEPHPRSRARRSPAPVVPRENKAMPRAPVATLLSLRCPAGVPCSFPRLCLS